MIGMHKQAKGTDHLPSTVCTTIKIFIALRKLHTGGLGLNGWNRLQSGVGNEHDRLQQQELLPMQLYSVLVGNINDQTVIVVFL
jgi:hypothetical protein